MKKDIPDLKVEDLAIAIAPLAENSAGIINPNDVGDMWEVYIINLKDEPIKNVLVNSRGYGEMNGEIVKTSTFRHFFEVLTPLDIQLIEPISTRLFDLANEYWVSFSYNGELYDKKYVFVAGALTADNFTPIPFLNRKGVMIR